MFTSVLLADVHLTGTFFLILVLALIAGAAIIAFLRRENQEVSKLKEDALDAAAFFQQIGLPNSAGFWNAVALGNLKKAAKELYVILSIFKSPSQRTAALIQVVDTYIWDVKSANDTAEIARLQGLLNNTAGAAPAAAPTGAALQLLSTQLNPMVAGAAPAPTGTVTFAPGSVTHTPPPVQIQTAPVTVQPPSVTTTATAAAPVITHTIAAAALPAVAAVAPAAVPAVAAVIAATPAA